MANQGSSLVRPPTQSRHSVYKKLIWFAPGRGPNGLTLVPWQGGRCLTGDTTIVDMLTPSYIAVSTQITGSAAQTVAERKFSRYTGLLASYLFVPIAIESLSPINEAGHSFLSELRL